MDIMVDQRKTQEIQTEKKTMEDLSDTQATQVQVGRPDDVDEFQATQIQVSSEEQSNGIKENGEGVQATQIQFSYQQNSTNDDDITEENNDNIIEQTQIQVSSSPTMTEEQTQIQEIFDKNLQKHTSDNTSDNTSDSEEEEMNNATQQQQQQQQQINENGTEENQDEEENINTQLQTVTASEDLEFDEEEGADSTLSAEKSAEETYQEKPQEKNNDDNDNDNDDESLHQEKQQEREEKHQGEAKVKGKTNKDGILIKRKREKEGGEEEMDKKKKKGKKNVNGDAIQSNEELDMDEEDGTENVNVSKQQINTYEEEFDKIMKHTKGKGRSSAKYEDISTKAKDAAEDLMNRMKLAAVNDRDNYKKRLPATEKLVLLPEVIEKCRKVFLQQSLIDDGLLAILKEWIQPLSGSLPDMNIRTSVLKILSDLPVKGETTTPSSADDFERGVDVESLKCGIGKWVKVLATHPEETVSNRKIASSIIERWSRLIYGLSDNYRELATKQTQIPISRLRNKRLNQQQQQQQQQQQHQKQQEDDVELNPSVRARVPKRDNFEFFIQPKFEKISRNTAKESYSQKKIAKKLQELSRKRHT